MCEYKFDISPAVKKFHLNYEVFYEVNVST
jgi:hypothetical protein